MGLLYMFWFTERAVGPHNIWALFKQIYSPNTMELKPLLIGLWSVAALNRTQSKVRFVRLSSIFERSELFSNYAGIYIVNTRDTAFAYSRLKLFSSKYVNRFDC